MDKKQLLREVRIFFYDSGFRNFKVLRVKNRYGRPVYGSYLFSGWSYRTGHLSKIFTLADLERHYGNWGAFFGLPS